MRSLLIAIFLIVSVCAERDYYNVRHVTGPRRGQFMRRRTAGEVEEYNLNGFIRRGELRSRREGNPEAFERRRVFVQSLWDRRRKERADRAAAAAAAAAAERQRASSSSYGRIGAGGMNGNGMQGVYETQWCYDAYNPRGFPCPR